MTRLSPTSIALGLLLLVTPAWAGQELTADDVREVMTAHGDEVKTCYLQHGMKQRTATGKVTVTVVVEKDGRARDVQVDAPGVRGPRLRRCVGESAAAWQFRATSSVTEVQLPFLFQHTQRRSPSAAR